MTDSNKEKDTIYSYHTFILPLRWNNSRSGKSADFEKIVKIIERNWEKSGPETEWQFDTNEDPVLYYNKYQYFYPQVRSVLFGGDPSVVRNFCLPHTKDQNIGHFYITKEFKENIREERIEKEYTVKIEDQTYSTKVEKETYYQTTRRIYDLQVNQIRLRIYNTGIMLLTIECENHGVDYDGNPQNSWKDIKYINNFGRRITIPFYSRDNSDCSECADCLELNLQNPEKPKMNQDPENPEMNQDPKNPGMNQDPKNPGMKVKADFKKKLSDAFSKRTGIELNYLSEIVTGLLNFRKENDEEEFTANPAEGTDKILITPALDDRMQVACMAKIDKSDIEKFTQCNNKTHEQAFLEDEETGKSLYEYVFIDNANSCTCQYMPMRTELLRKHVYSRWNDYGSIYGITAQSLVYLTTTDSAPFLTSNFLTEYIEMFSLCIAQRASLVAFQRKISDLSCRIQKKKKYTAAATSTLMDIQEEFSSFEAQLGFSEISSQEQAIEMYDMMQESLLIKRETENVKEQIDGLNSVAQTSQGRHFNVIGYIFTIITASYTIFDIIFSIMRTKVGLIAEETKEIADPIESIKLSADFCLNHIDLIIKIVLAVGLIIFFWYRFTKRKLRGGKSWKRKK